MTDIHVLNFLKKRETKLIQNNIIITVHFIYLWMAVLSSSLPTPFSRTWIKHKIENYVQILDKLSVLEHNL